MWFLVKGLSIQLTTRTCLELPRYLRCFLWEMCLWAGEMTQSFLSYVHDQKLKFSKYIYINI